MVREIDSIRRLNELLKDGAQLVDVREEGEVFSGSLAYHKHWPLSTFARRESEISKTAPTVFYCRSGLRSFKAAEIASEWTEQEVFILSGGYMNFREQK